jgi:hypothetical protein
MPINTAQIQSLLRPGLAAVFGSYPKYPTEWSEIFETYTSDKAVEYETEIKLLGLAAIRPEGAPTLMQDMGQRFIYSYVHRYIAIGFTITKQAMADNLYKDKFPLMARAMRDSMLQTKEILGASLLNNGFNPAFPIGDGQPIFSQNHPIDTGTVSNTFSVATDLNEASLESAIISIQQFRDQAGLLCNTQPRKLIVPTQGQFTAERLLESAFRTSTPNNDISAIYNKTSIPKGYRVNHYLSLPNSWYVLTDAPNSWKHYIREKIETDVYSDMSTDNLIAKTVERYSFGISNFRGGFASQGT